MTKYYKLLFTFLVLGLLAACSSKSDKEFFDSAQNFIKDSKFSEALTEFEMLVEEHSGSEYAPKALAEIAKLYHANLIPNISKEESYKKAVQYYKQVFDEYPKSPEAENSLFMSGFVKANELNDFNNAKVDYELFLKNFPQSELSQSVKIELDNLGIKPEEMLQQHANKSK